MSIHIDDLRKELMSTLQALRDRDNPMEPERAKAVAIVAGVMVDSARAEIEYLKLDNPEGSGFMAPLEPTLLPKGIKGVTKHRLGR